METRQKLIEERVRESYWELHLNCAVTTLNILGEIYDVEIHQQTRDAAVAMHGAGKYGAQCGLLEGGLMFIGIYGKQKGLSKEQLVSTSYRYAGEFKKAFGSLQCTDLRPEGFLPELAPLHLCTDISIRGVAFTVDFIDRVLEG